MNTIWFDLKIGERPVNANGEIREKVAFHREAQLTLNENIECIDDYLKEELLSVLENTIGKINAVLKKEKIAV